MAVKDFLSNEFCYEVSYADVLGGQIAMRQILTKGTFDADLPTLVFLHEGLQLFFLRYNLEKNTLG